MNQPIPHAAPKINCLCPYCGAGNRVLPEEATNTECFTCRHSFRILADRSGHVRTIRQVPEPLHLPKGSIRALTTLLVAGTSWLLVYRGQAVPNCLFGLLLAIIGYYFGFRKGNAPAAPNPEASGVGESQATALPLYLPGGSIRLLLIGGFILSAFWLIGQKRFMQSEVLEFYAVFFGLVVGHVVGRATARFEGSSASILANHAKGVVVLAASFALAALLLNGDTYDLGLWPLLGLSCIISFYFGSK